MKNKRQTWIALFGKIKPTGDGFIYEPNVAPPETPTAMQQSLFAMAKSDIDFSAGVISFKTKIQQKDDRVQLVLNQGLADQIFVGINVHGSAYGISVFRNGAYESLVTAGSPDALETNRHYSLRVEAFGSNILLFVDDVEVCRANYLIQKAQLAVFVASQGEISVTEYHVVKSRSKAFVVMQFTEEFNALYGEVIKPVCEDFGFECIRGDDVYNNGLIIEDITRSIREAAVVIADVTPNNPNVFYEVGFSHGINKPTILLSDRKRDHLPFDVSGFRTLFYDNTIGGKTTIEERLRNHLKNIKA